jgi:hypothetical protein
LVVPVFPAAGSVKPTRRACHAVPALITSAIIVVMMNAVDSLSARYSLRRRHVEHVPSRSSTRRISDGGVTIPWFAKAEYAAVIASSETSPDPSASDGTARHVADAEALRVADRRRDADLLQQLHRGAVARR